jgi:phosphatidate cytidylyltransferase
MLELALENPLAAALGGMWAALIAGTAASLAIGGRELVARARTWWWIITPVTVALLAGTTATVLFVAAVSFLALRELLSLLPFRAADRPALLAAFAAIPIQYGLVLAHWYGLFAIFLPVYGLAFLTARTVLAGETGGFLRSVGLLQLAVLVAVYDLSHLAFLAVLPLRDAAPAGGCGLLLFLFLTIALGDVAQFAAGRTFGRRAPMHRAPVDRAPVDRAPEDRAPMHRVVPRVSPGKTWEGLAGGLLATTVLGATLGPCLAPFGAAEGAAIGLLLGALGFAGDITLSAVKRDLGLKDSGACLPGHGGLMDRLDSLIFAAPVFFHLLRFFHGA